MQRLEKTSGRWVVAQEVNRESLYDRAIPLAGMHIHARSENAGPHTSSCMNIHNSMTPDSQKAEAAHMLLDLSVGK